MSVQRARPHVVEEGSAAKPAPSYEVVGGDRAPQAGRSIADVAPATRLRPDPIVLGLTSSAARSGWPDVPPAEGGIPRGNAWHAGEAAVRIDRGSLGRAGPVGGDRRAAPS